jgi:hypothetical protein
MTIPRRVVKAATIRQDNDASCFGGPRGNESKHNKAAKRLASRRLRRLIKKEADTQFNAENQP